MISDDIFSRTDAFLLRKRNRKQHNVKIANTINGNAQHFASEFWEPPADAAVAERDGVISPILESV